MISAFGKSSQRLSCSCHNINLVLTNYYKNGDKWLLDVDEKVRAAAEHVKRAGLNSKLGIFVKMEMTVRWNTKLFMYQSISEAYDEIMKHIENLTDNKKRKELSTRLKISSDQKNILANAVKFLDIFQLSTVALSARNVPTINKVYPLRCVMLEHSKNFAPDLSGFDEDELEEHTLQWKTLKEKVAILIDQKFTVNNVHKVAMFLDPMFKSMVKESNKTREEIKRLTITFYKEFIADDNSDDEASFDHPTNYSMTLQESVDNSLFASFIANDARSLKAPNFSIEQEVEEYSILSTDADLISFWKKIGRQKFPKLSKLALKILSIQASSVASESAFSTQGNIQTDARSRLTPGHVEELLFLHYFYQEKYPNVKQV